MLNEVCSGVLRSYCFSLTVHKRRKIKPVCEVFDKLLSAAFSCLWVVLDCISCHNVIITPPCLHDDEFECFLSTWHLNPLFWLRRLLWLLVTIGNSFCISFTTAWVCLSVIRSIANYIPSHRHRLCNYDTEFAAISQIHYLVVVSMWWNISSFDGVEVNELQTRGKREKPWPWWDSNPATPGQEHEVLTMRPPVPSISS